MNNEADKFVQVRSGHGIGSGLSSMVGSVQIGPDPPTLIRINEMWHSAR
jgi:hypothetical protein